MTKKNKISLFLVGFLTVLVFGSVLAGNNDQEVTEEEWCYNFAEMEYGDSGMDVWALQKVLGKEEVLFLPLKDKGNDSFYGPFTAIGVYNLAVQEGVIENGEEFYGAEAGGEVREALDEKYGCEKGEPFGYCDVDRECGWVAVNCCPYNFNSEWECMNMERTATTLLAGTTRHLDKECPEDPGCSYGISYMPPENCICVSGECVVEGECNCPSTVSPVCGEDGETYDNKCLAECEGVEIAHEGECKEEDEEENDEEENGDLIGCLERKGVVIYGTSYCPACIDLVDSFGGEDVISPLYVNCDNYPSKCQEEMRTGYVPEVQIEGELYEDRVEPQSLAEDVGCPY